MPTRRSWRKHRIFSHRFAIVVQPSRSDLAESQPTRRCRFAVRMFATPGQRFTAVGGIPSRKHIPARSSNRTLPWHPVRLSSPDCEVDGSFHGGGSALSVVSQTVPCHHFFSTCSSLKVGCRLRQRLFVQCLLSDIDAAEIRLKITIRRVH